MLLRSYYVLSHPVDSALHALRANRQDPSLRNVSLHLYSLGWVQVLRDALSAIRPAVIGISATTYLAFEISQSRHRSRIR